MTRTLLLLSFLLIGGQAWAEDAKICWMELVGTPNDERSGSAIGTITPRSPQDNLYDAWKLCKQHQWLDDNDFVDSPWRKPCGRILALHSGRQGWPGEDADLKFVEGVAKDLP